MSYKSQYDNKIIKLDELESNITAKDPALRVVQCHGVFDLLHIGHIRHFQMAKKHGDILVVTITPDRFVNKGPNRPSFQEELRAAAVAALDCVDYVIINSHPTAVEAIKVIKPHFYVKGSEYQIAQNDITAKIQDEIDAVKSVGGDIVFTNDITFSSSALINQYFPRFSENVLAFLTEFKTKYDEAMIFKYLEKAKKLNVLVVGEAIVDIYHFSEVIGKAGKEPILAAKHRSREIYAGGALAIANHLSDFCEKVTCLTYLGEHAEYEEVIRACLKPNVELVAIYKKDAPTIAKRRYIEEYLQQKLFEVYEINDDLLERGQQLDFIEKLNGLLATHDLSIVADYGHGLLDELSIDALVNHSKFLAVNTQSNASNHGFNCISKYARADYVSLASRELQLNYRQKHLSVEDQLRRLLKEFDYKTVMVTTGKSGACVCKQNEELNKVPAFATNIIDRVGAGDAVLSITSLYAYLNAPTELIGFIGNIVGAEAVSGWGNKTSIQKISLMKHISHLLK